MTVPVVYVSTWRIKEGGFEAYQRFYGELLKIVHEREPEIVAFLAYANDDGTELTNVHVYRDTARLEDHVRLLTDEMDLVPEDLSAVFRFLEPVRVEVLGTRGAMATAMDAGLEVQGVPLALKRRYLGGFTCPAAPSA